MSLDLYIYENMLKLINERESMISEQILYGQIEDFTNFKEQKARLLELATLKQELKSLLEKVTTDEFNTA
jgi:macrodomain Ter protein organizer (MatP/YcbG family)|tara:strand:+ start:1320 stop:1529 length:210 start_codon:yes stop_codon:yes gene_type:complete